MKTIGLIGGMSWESSQVYYRVINELINDKLGGLHSAKLIMYSVDFVDLEKNQRKYNWQKATELIINVAKKIELIGADFIVICSNTGHQGADIIQENINIPLLNIVDVVGEEVNSKKIKRAGLLGTKYTMEMDYYTDRLSKKGIEVIIPNKEERVAVNNIIYQELCLGIIKESSKIVYKRVVKNLIKKGADGIILGCTEIPLLIKQNDVKVPTFDSTMIHAKAAVEYAIKK